MPSNEDVATVDFATLLRGGFRRTLLLGAAVGVVGLVALVLTGHVLLGVFGCVGIVFGLVDAVLIYRSAVAHGGDDPVARQRLALGVAVPLVVTLAVALAVAIVFPPDGIGVFAGLVVFQVLMMTTAALPLLRAH